MEDLVTTYTMRSGNNWGTGVLLFKDKSEKEILVGLRTDTKNWATPGGKVNVGETVEQGMRREIKEETNLSDIYLEFIDVYVGAFDNEKVWCSFLFKGYAKGGQIKPQLTEFSELKWVTVEKFNKLNLFKPTKIMVEVFKEKEVI